MTFFSVLVLSCQIISVLFECWDHVFFVVEAMVDKI